MYNHIFDIPKTIRAHRLQSPSLSPWSSAQSFLWRAELGLLLLGHCHAEDLARLGGLQLR